MKKRISQFVIIIIIIALVSESTLIFLLLEERKQDKIAIETFEKAKFEKLSFVESVEQNYDVTEYERMQAIQKTPKEVDDLTVTGWIPDWDFQDGFNTLQNNKHFTGVSPFWYTSKGDGSLQSTSFVNDPDFINYVRSNNIELIPTITNFDEALLSEMLNNDNTRRQHIDNIVDVAVSNGFDGIDLDYESFYLEDKELFFDFLQGLSIRMIEANKKLVFTTHPKWGDDVVYSGLPQTRKVLDYKRIADLVDEVRIMAYEYSGRNNKYYGPNAPLVWVEDIIRFALSTGVPREKLVLGIPTYSYDYPEREKLAELDYYPASFHENNDQDPAVAYYNTVIDDIKETQDYTEEFNEEWGEMVLKYEHEGRDRTVVYLNDKSIEQRKQLAADFGIKGIAYWRLGDEGSLNL